MITSFSLWFSFIWMAETDIIHRHYPSVSSLPKGLQSLVLNQAVARNWKSHPGLLRGWWGLRGWSPCGWQPSLATLQGVCALPGCSIRSGGGIGNSASVWDVGISGSNSPVMPQYLPFLFCYMILIFNLKDVKTENGLLFACRNPRYFPELGMGHSEFWGWELSTGLNRC